MKTHSFFYVVATIGVLVTGSSCGKKSDPEPQIVAGQGSATIKLTQNGQVVTEFKTTKASGFGGDSYSVIIASPDEKHSLLLNIEGQSPGTYPFISGSQILTKGQANFMFQSFALPEVYAGTVGLLVPATGQAVLSAVTKTRCTGSFSSTGKNAKDGKTYTLEGTFDTPVQN